MSARAGNSIRSSRPLPVNGARLDGGRARAPTSSSSPTRIGNAANNSAADAGNALSARSQNRSQVLPKEPLPSSSAPALFVRRPQSHSRNIPYHSGSARTVLPRPQRGTSQPQPPVNGAQQQQQQQQQLVPRPRANSHNAVPQQQQQPQQQKQRPSPRQVSPQMPLDASRHTSIGGIVPSSAPAAYPLPRERGVYPAPHGAARPSPPPHRVTNDEGHPNSHQVSDGHYGATPSAMKGSRKQQQQQPRYPQPSPPRVQLKAGGVFLESMDTIPKANWYVAPSPQPHSASPPAATSTALTIRPSPPLNSQRRRSMENSRDHGTNTDDLSAYAHAMRGRRPPAQQQQQPSYPPQTTHSTYYQDEAPQQQQQQQQQSLRPADYYALAPSLRLAQHRHVRHIVAGEINREPPQPHYQPMQLQDWAGEQRETSGGAREERRPAAQPSRRAPSAPPLSQQPPQPPQKTIDAAQRPALEYSTSLLSDTSSTRSGRTRQVFRRPPPSQRRPLMTGALPAGSPYGAKPTYAVVMPRTHRVPAGLYVPPSLPASHPRQQQWEEMEVEASNVEPTVEEPYLVLDEEGGRVVEYEPELMPPSPPQRQQRQLQHQQQHQQQVPASVRTKPPMNTPPTLPPPPQQPQPHQCVERQAPVMRQVIHYYPAPQQQQQQALQDVYDEPTPSDASINDNSYSYEDHGATMRPSHCSPPAPPPSSQKPNPRQRKSQRSTLPPPPPSTQRKQSSSHDSGKQQRPRPSGRHDGLLARTPSNDSQRVPPPTLPPPHPLHSDDNFRPSHLDNSNSIHRNHAQSYHGNDARYAAYPTHSDVYADGNRRPSLQEQSEQPSSATLAAPLRPGYHLDERHLLPEQEDLPSDRRLEESEREGEWTEASSQLQQQQPAARSARQRHRGSPPAGRRPRPQQTLPPPPKTNTTSTPSDSVEEMHARSMSTRTQAIPAGREHVTRRPLPPPEAPQDVYEDEEEEGAEMVPPPPPPQQQQQQPADSSAKEEEAEEEPSAASQKHSIVKDPNGSQSLDLDSTVDPEDLQAQQEAKKLAAELVRRSQMPPTPYVAPQPMYGPASYSDHSDGETTEGDDPSTKAKVMGEANSNTTALAPENDRYTNTANTQVAVPLPVPQETPQQQKQLQRREEAVVVNVEEAAPALTANEEEQGVKPRNVQGKTKLNAPGSAVSSSDVEEENIATAHARPTSADSEVPHSVHVAQGKETMTVEGDNRAQKTPLERSDLSAPEQRPSNNAVANLVAAQGCERVSPPLPPEEPQRPAYPQEDTAEEDADANPPADDEPHHQPSLPQQQQPAQDALAAQEELESDAAVESNVDDDSNDCRGNGMPPSSVQLATPMPQSEAPEMAVVVEDDQEGVYVDDDDDDLAMSPLDAGERYGYVDPLEEAAMDAAYMLDTLEDQYVRVSEETGKEMEDLVHVVELNRYDRAVEPRFFLPKGQYSDVLPLLRYPATNAAAEAGADGNAAVPNALTYIPLTETAYVNLCAVIWLSRFHSEDTARLLAVAQGPSPPPPQTLGDNDHDDPTSLEQLFYFDHPSANLVEQLDSVIAMHVQAVVDETCAQSGEPFPTACTRLADRSNLAYLPPAVWQQATTASQLSVTSIADHVTEVLLTATVPQEAARRQAARRAMTSEVERQAQRTWSLFLGAVPWNYEEAVEAEMYAAMPTAAARLSYAFMHKARMRNLESGLGALTFSALSAQIPEAAVMDSLLMQEKLRLALRCSFKNVAACCALRQKAVRNRGVSSSPGNSQANEHDDSSLNDDANNSRWDSPVFSAYMQLWESEQKSTAAVATPAGSTLLDRPDANLTKVDDSNGNHKDYGDDEGVVDLYSVAVQLSCFFPTKTERGMHQLCAALIEDLIAMDALAVPEEVCTPEGVVLTDRTAIVDALVVEGAQAMRHIITVLSELGYSSTISTDDYATANGRVDTARMQEAMESYLVLFAPAVMYFLSSRVPVDELFRYVRSDGPPSMQPHTLGRKSTFVEVLRLQHIAETIQYAMEMQDAILVASQYNHLVAMHYKKIKQQRKARPTPRSIAEELQMDAVVVGQSMDLLLHAAPLLSRELETNASLLAEPGNNNNTEAAAGANATGHHQRGTAAEDDEDIMLGQDGGEDESNGGGEEVLLRAVLIALCCADPQKPVEEVQEYLRHLLTLYAEIRDEHNNPVDSTDPLQVAQARARAAELAMVDWFGQTAADGTLLPGAAPARCDETRVNAEELAALCPRVLSRRVGLPSSAVADAAAVISASAQTLARGGGNAVERGGNEDSVLMADALTRPPLAR